MPFRKSKSTTALRPSSSSSSSSSTSTSTSRNGNANATTNTNTSTMNSVNTPAAATTTTTTTTNTAGGGKSRTHQIRQVSSSSINKQASPGTGGGMFGRQLGSGRSLEFSTAVEIGPHSQNGAGDMSQHSLGVTRLPQDQFGNTGFLRSNQNSFTSFEDEYLYDKDDGCISGPGSGPGAGPGAGPGPGPGSGAGVGFGPADYYRSVSRSSSKSIGKNRGIQKSATSTDLLQSSLLNTSIVSDVESEQICKRMSIHSKSGLRKTKFEALHEDELVLILGFLNARDYGQLAMTCKYFKWVVDLCVDSLVGKRARLLPPAFSNKVFLNNIHFLDFVESSLRTPAIACGEEHTAHVTRRSGEVWTWGSGSDGQLGLGDFVDRSYPSKVFIENAVEPSTSTKSSAPGSHEPALTSRKAASVTCGKRHTLVLTLRGNVLSFGLNVSGELGIGVRCERNSVPTLVQGGLESKRVVQICAGNGYSCFITSDGKLYKAGTGLPVEVIALPGEHTMTLDEATSAAVADASATSSGAPSPTSGPTTLPTTGPTSGPTTGPTTGTGRNPSNLGHSIERSVSGTSLYLQNPSNRSAAEAQASSPQQHAAQRTLDRDRDGDRDRDRDRHNDTASIIEGPVQIHAHVGEEDSRLAQVGNEVLREAAEGGARGASGTAAAVFGAMAVVSAASTTRDPEDDLDRSLLPHEIERGDIPNDARIVHVAAGEHHIVILTHDGLVYTAGDGIFGQLGLGPRIGFTRVPRLITALQDLTIVQVAAGSVHSAALTNDGRIFTFGSARNGRLGLGAEVGVGANAIVWSPLEVRLPENSRALMIAAGFEHTIMLNTKGQVMSFGNSTFGQLGNSSSFWSSSQPSPFAVVLNGDRMLQVAGGGQHSAALTQQGKIWMCGNTSLCGVSGSARGGRAQQSSNLSTTTRRMTRPRVVTVGQDEDHLLGHSIRQDVGAFASSISSMRNAHTLQPQAHPPQVHPPQVREQTQEQTQPHSQDASSASNASNASTSSGIGIGAAGATAGFYF